MSELLFECYNVPSVAYGIDSLFSLYNNMPSSGELIQCCHGRLCVVILLSSEPCMVHSHKFVTSMFLSQKKNQTLLMVYHGQEKIAILLVSVIFNFSHLQCFIFAIYTFFHVLSSIFQGETHKTMNTRKIILWKCYCVVRNQPIRHEYWSQRYFWSSLLTTHYISGAEKRRPEIRLCPQTGDN